jgi:hypothetical protein
MALSEVIRQKRPDMLRVAAHYGARDVRIFGVAVSPYLRERILRDAVVL